MTTTDTPSRTVGRPFGSGQPVVRIQPLTKPHWAAQAACAGKTTAVWFSEDPDGAYSHARTICAACPVQPDCLEWALASRVDHGLWGGLNPDERRRIRRRRQRAPQTINLRDGAL